jgi:hypothetical protein
MKGTLLTSLSSAFRNALIVVAGITMLTIFTSPAMATKIHFGVRCQDDFQNGWAPTIDVVTGCTDFISEIQTAHPVDFAFNLHGAQTAFYFGQAPETCNSCGGVDSVDFFFLSTHGTIASNNADYAGYAMWDDACAGTNPPGCIAWTPQMRLGDSGKQLKVLATFSCDTFKNDDKLFTKRWGAAFAGGLKVGVGGHDLLYTDNDASAMQDFATYMLEGNSIGNAWLNAVYNDNNANHPTVANTGANKASCWKRQGVALGGVMSEKVLRDGQIGYTCWTNWN